MNIYLCLLHFFGGIFAVLNGIKVFKRIDHRDIKHLQQVIAEKDKIIANYERTVLRQQAVLDYDRTHTR